MRVVERGARRLGRGIGRGLLIALVLALVTSASVVVSRPADAAGTPLRQVDWRAVLANDPALTIDPTAYQPPVEIGPYVQVAPQYVHGSDALSGHALLDDISYGDADGDGAEEATIMLHSGGTAGVLGFLLYREGTPAPQLVLVETGYKLGVKIVNGRVQVTQPEYVGFEPNCCPSASTVTTAVLEGDRLVTVTSETTPNEAQEVTVWGFYSALSDKRFADAYAFLSPAYQQQNPFEPWKDGYATTQSIQVDTAAGAAPNEVQVELTATDRRPGGGTLTRRFRGTWTVIWSAEQKRWLLDSPSIRPAT